MNIERPSSAPYVGRSPRIALFSGNYNYTLDGANKTLNRLVGHLLNEAGFQVRIYSPTSPRPAFSPVGDLVSVPSVPIPLRPDYRVALGLPQAIRRDIEAFAPDVIHLSAPDPLGLGALRLARRLGTPVVASVHTHFEEYLRYYGLGLLKPVLQRRLQALYNACDYVVAPTRAIADQIQAGGARAPVRVWARGVDQALFHPGRRSDAWRRAHGFEGRPVIAFLGRLVAEKGLGIFVETVRRVRRVRPDAAVLVIGQGPASAWLQAQLPEAVFTDFLSGDALATAVASADLLLNPSTTETFGNVTLEAMACGLPVVCADVPSSRALVEQGRTGLRCAPYDADAYGKAVLGLLNDPDRRAAMSAAASAQGGDHSWSQVMDQMVQLYCEALGGSRRALARPSAAVHGLDWRNSGFAAPAQAAAIAGD